MNQTCQLGKNRGSLNHVPSLTSIESSVPGEVSRKKVQKGKGGRGSWRSRLSGLSSVSSTEVSPENFVFKANARGSSPSVFVSLFRCSVFLVVFFAGTLLAVIVGSPLRVGQNGVVRVNPDPFKLVPWRSAEIDATLSFAETVYTLEEIASATVSTLGRVQWVAFYTGTERRVAQVTEVRKSLVSGELAILLGSGEILHFRAGQDYSTLERPDDAIVVRTSNQPVSGVGTSSSCFSCPVNSHIPTNETWRSDNASACVCNAGYTAHSLSLPFRCEPASTRRILSSSSLCLGSDASGNQGPISDNTPCELPFVFNDESTATTINFSTCATLDEARPNGVGPYSLEVEDIGYLASWCPPQGLSTYQRMGAGEVKNYNWGLCVVCPTSAPTVSPTLAPTNSPSATPSEQPTTEQPSAAPTTTPTQSPLMNFAQNSSTSLDLNATNSTQSTGNATNTSRDFTNHTNFSAAPVSTGIPSLSPTHVPSNGPEAETRSPTSEPTSLEDGTNPEAAASIQLVLEAGSGTSYLDMWSALTSSLEDNLRNLTDQALELEAAIHVQERISLSFEGHVSDDTITEILRGERCGSLPTCHTSLVSTIIGRRRLAQRLSVYLFELDISSVTDSIPRLNLSALASAISGKLNSTDSLGNTTFESLDTLVSAEVNLFADAGLNSSELLGFRQTLNISGWLETAIGSTATLNVTVVDVDLCQGQTCSGNGVCANGECVCNQGFSGLVCDSVVVVSESPTSASCGVDEFTSSCIGDLLLEEAEWYCSSIFSGRSLCHFEDLKKKLELDYKKAHSSDVKLNSQEYPELNCAISQGDVWTQNQCLNGEGSIVLSCTSGKCAASCKSLTTAPRNAAICCQQYSITSGDLSVRVALAMPSTQPVS